MTNKMGVFDLVLLKPSGEFLHNGRLRRSCVVTKQMAVKSGPTKPLSQWPHNRPVHPQTMENDDRALGLAFCQVELALHRLVFGFLCNAQSW